MYRFYDLKCVNCLVYQLKATLKMKLKRLTLTNFRCFSSFSMAIDERLTVIVAKNGAGKTSILDAIATGLDQFITRLPKVSGINPKDSDFLVYSDGSKPAYMRIALESTHGIRWDRTEKRDQTQKTQNEIPTPYGTQSLNDNVDKLIEAYNDNSPFHLPIFAYYGTGRGVFEVPQKHRDFKKRCFEALEGALEAKANFRRFFEYFYFLEKLERRGQKQDSDYQQPELQTIRKAIESAMPMFRNPRTELLPLCFLIDWQTDNEIKTLRIEQLSDGNRTMLAMIMDIAARMAEANPDRENPLEIEGIILIDEVELHLHPGWQQTILPSILKTFPNLQFIVTTHSPQVLTTVPSSSIRAIHWDSREQPSLMPIEFSEGAESQQLLEDILGIKPRPQNIDIVKNLNRYLELISLEKWDSTEAIALRSKLNKWGHGYEPALANADIDIRLHTRRRERT